MTSRSFLRTPSEAAGPGDEQVIEDLVDTLEANRSRCVGMAANMIGVGKRIIVFVDEDLGGRITVMLNPVITASDGAFDTQEGCLSLTGERRTLRYRRIEVNYEDRRFRARHATFKPMPTAAMPQMAARKTHRSGLGRPRRHTGVYVPAMST